MRIERFEDMEIWQNSVKLATDIFKITKNKSMQYDFGVVGQIRRSSFSISSNIAEGFEYNNNAQFIRFLRYAKGSVGELRSQIYILKEAELIGEGKYSDLYFKCIELSKQIAAFIKYLKNAKPPY